MLICYYVKLYYIMLQKGSNFKLLAYFFLTTLIFLFKNYLNKQFNSLYYFKFDLFGLCLKVNYFSLKINDDINVTHTISFVKNIFKKYF